MHQRTHAPRDISDAEITEYLTRYGITFPIALDGPTSLVPDTVPRDRVRGNGAMYSTYEVKRSPALYLIDKKGILRCSPADKDLNEWVRRLLAE